VTSELNYSKGNILQIKQVSSCLDVEEIFPHSSDDDFQSYPLLAVPHVVFASLNGLSEHAKLLERLSCQDGGVF
jgi:hypothetical protein